MIISKKDFDLYRENEEIASFNRIGEVVADEVGAKDIYLDVFEAEGRTHTYIVVEFKDSALSVRNANGNSLIANIQELAKMLTGGYYVEVEEYKRLKNLKGEH